MFIDFTFSNFRSFRDTTSLSMVAAKLRSKYPQLDRNNVFEIPSGERLLKSKAIYGANASGKSNIAKAAGAFLAIINNRKNALANAWADRFILRADEQESEPITFQYTFLSHGTEYRYGFEFTEKEIVSEWLFGSPDGKEIPYFVKELSDVNVIDEHYFVEGLAHVDAARKRKGKLFQPTSLFLLAASDNGGTLSEQIVDTITDLYLVDGDKDNRLHYPVLEALKLHLGFEKEVISLLNGADIDIFDFTAKELDEETFKEVFPAEMVKLAEERNLLRPTEIETARVIRDNLGKIIRKVTGDFDDWESAGTQKFFYVGALVLLALKQGRPFFIDEFDARLHPRLSKKIVDLFNSPSTNPKNAQFIFITHNVGLLKNYIFRRDQIAFVDRNRFGMSTIATLAEFKGVRNDASYDKDYLLGAYHGVPIVNGLESVVAKSVNKNESEAQESE